MKILFYDMGSYTVKDIIYHLEKEGHSCQILYYHFANKYDDAFFCERFGAKLQKNNYDFVFSVNFFPLVAQICYEKRIRYVSWSYDSPLDAGFQKYFTYDTNYIFLFDRIEAAEYRALGYEQVFHLPLAVHTERLDTLQFASAQQAKYSADVSFVGRIYDSPLDTLLYQADDETKGYIEGALQAQFRVYGYYFIDELITDELLKKVNDSFPGSIKLTSRGLSYAIASKITRLERTFLLEQMGELFDTKFYSTQAHTFPTPVQSCGPVKYFTEMPGVFRYSKLNLNPTLKSIRSGIPLRALDIMASKGVLFSNYQPELAEYFEDGRDVIMYNSMEDAFEKAAYYLQHTDLLTGIARNGYEITKSLFHYPDRINAIINVITKENYEQKSNP